VQATGHIGCIREREAGFICGTGAIRLRVKSENDSINAAFLSHVLANPMSVEWFKFHAIGATMPNLNESIIRSFSFAIPPLGEQLHIAHILGSLDDKIELNRQMNETLEAIARALFKSWFVDFDPVRAKAEGRDPGLPKTLTDLFPARLVDSEFRGIPEGWRVVTLRDLADLDKGLSYTGEGLVDVGGMPMIGLGCFAGNGEFKGDNIKRYQGEYRDRHLVRTGDLLIANTDMTQNRVILGSPALLPDLPGEHQYLFTHHTFAVRFKSGVERWKRYVYFTLLRPEFREIAEGFATGTTVLALPKDGVLNYSIVLPGEALRVAFERHVGELLAAREARGRESRTLDALRAALLPRLVSGELRVKDAERFAAGVA
jgi:type I restriction enzyme S subunit